jgi:predicted transcriptional regulator
MDAEQVFKALADHHRRHLIDVLSKQDGLSLNELCSHLPMTRIGVMKHLRILEQAGLVTTAKVGRERLHYLNSAPIRTVAEWAEGYRRHWDERMDRLDAYLRDLQQQAQSAATEQHESVQNESVPNESDQQEPEENVDDN